VAVVVVEVDLVLIALGVVEKVANLWVLWQWEGFVLRESVKVCDFGYVVVWRRCGFAVWAGVLPLLGCLVEGDGRRMSASLPS
jgi:hypothetical protein